MSAKYRQKSTLMRGTRPEDLSEILSTTFSDVSVKPVGNGLFSFDTAFAGFGELSFGRANYQGDFQCVRHSAANRIFFVMPSRGIALIRSGGREFHSTPGRATIVDLNRPQSLHFQGERQHLVLSIGKDKLAEQLTSILERSVKGDPQFQSDFNLDHSIGPVLMSLVAIACDGFGEGSSLRQSPLAAANLCSTIISLILENIPHRYSAEMARDTASPLPRHVKRAIDFMSAHLREPLTMDEIAVAADISVRALQSGFKRFRSTTPTAFLQQLRLSAAREEIANSNGQKTIAEIAAKWGYGHVGRFAADYKKRFGELPSHTRRR
jgi:AraC-like DNA-binding protein